MTPEHPVILGDQMNAAAGSQDAKNLRHYLSGVGHRLQNVAAYDGVERRGLESESQRISHFEANPFSELGASAPGAFQMRLFEIDAGERGLRILRGQSGDDLAGPASEVEHRAVAQRMAIEDRLFLRPDRLGLRGEIPDHRLISHFFRLRTAALAHVSATAPVPRPSPPP